MLEKDILRIDANLSALVELTDLDRLVPKLLENKTFSTEMINKILNPNHRLEQQKTDLYLELQRRGPDSFQKLIDALVKSNHGKLAAILLDDIKFQNLSINNRSESSLNSTPRTSSGSLSDSQSSANINNAQVYSETQSSTSTQERRVPPSSLDFISVPSNVTEFPLSGVSSEDNPDSNGSSPTHACRIQPFALPNYLLPITEKLRDKTELTPADCINLSIECKPVIVKKTQVKGGEGRRGVEPYKMTSQPRGYLLIINNINFRTLPTRHGAQNDDTRLRQLFEQLGFEVISYRDRTKMEMVRINEEFAKRPEFGKVDCVCVCFMSHGQEGYSEEDTEIVGVDEIGYKTSEIVAQYYPNNCPLLNHKPKLFIFQSCRIERDWKVSCSSDVNKEVTVEDKLIMLQQDLQNIQIAMGSCNNVEFLTDDGGVLLDHGVSDSHIRDMNGTYSRSRTVTDGRKYNSLQVFKSRTYSDLLIAFPSPPGHAANRDTFQGAWFIQTIVDVFSEHAWEHHIDNLFKIVDQKISKLANMLDTNFQTVTIQHVGFSKHLYFNPGYYDDGGGGGDGKSLRLSISKDGQDEGMDVVDGSEKNAKEAKELEAVRSEKETRMNNNQKINNYSRLDDESPTEDKDCFKFRCNPC